MGRWPTWPRPGYWPATTATATASATACPGGWSWVDELLISIAVHDIKPTSDGGSIAVGAYMDDPFSPPLVWLLRLGAEGSILSRRQYEDFGQSRGVDLRQFPSGELALAVDATAQLWLARFDGSGSLLWQRVYGELAPSVDSIDLAETPGGDLVVATTVTGPQAGFPANWIMRLDGDDSDSGIFPAAPEHNDGVDNQCPGDTGYGQSDELEGMLPVSDSEVCWDDPVSPASGETGYYLVRPLTPFVGEWGTDSTGTLRAPACVR